MHLFIKNMVCDRCIMAVQRTLDQQGLAYTDVRLGEVELPGSLSQEQQEALRTSLREIGFELLDDKKARIVEKIKNAIVSLVHRGDDEFNMKLSALLEEKLQMDYHYLTSLFTSIEGVTIEKYTILQRIEKAKELLAYNELSLSEISYQMGYSSVQHLSQQFKKVTGMTPSQFRNLKENNRKPLDKV
ncbi:AraC family transcriptional regulator [Flaviaesturariibacter flavus]|uniref:AraC family transcriptional regulator n=1 Tax=Flaviaesturariibacter flavus TaxID=2502780 RepID=A0A4R1B839_9BACT|nr:helix-turn-helix transcriptional regulator [Flaviaesturariibacter flavus]TCJ12153.1 AraC family transcriptional regulator [Flaviaesturariibacter flavus]